MRYSSASAQAGTRSPQAWNVYSLYPYLYLSSFQHLTRYLYYTTVCSPAPHGDLCLLCLPSLPRTVPY